MPRVGEPLGKSHVNIASRCAFPSITKSCPKLFRQPQKLLGVDTAQDCAFNLEHNLTSYNVLRNLPSLCSISYLFVVQMALPPTLKLLLSPTEADCVTSSPYPPAYHPTAHSFIRSQYKVEIVTLIIRKWITNARKKIWRIGDAGILAEDNNKPLQYLHGRWRRRHLGVCTSQGATPSFSADPENSPFSKLTKHLIFRQIIAAESMEGKWWRSTNLQGWRGGVLMVHYIWELGRKETFPFPQRALF